MLSPAPFFEVVSHYVGLELGILLPQPSQGWNYVSMTLHLVFLSEPTAFLLHGQGILVWSGPGTEGR